jgi:DNA repair protein RecO (recombination protein O)
MAANIKDTGFLLRKISWSESSLILKAYTREHGVVSFMAKGAKRQNSRLHGLLEPVIHLQFLFPGHSRGEMRILSDVALLRDFPGVRDDIVKHSLAQACGEVILKYMPDEARAPDFHDLLLSVTGKLEAAPANRRALEILFDKYLLDFCRISGFQPQFRFCVRCEARVFGPEAGVATGQTIAFEVDQGGPVCSRCHRDEGSSLRLREGILRWLEFVQNGSDAAGEPPESPESSPENGPVALPDISWRDAVQAEEFLLLYLGRHAGGQKPLKSVSVWRALMDT